MARSALSVPPVTGALVMSTGILAVAFSSSTSPSDSFDLLADALLAFACLQEVCLALLVVMHFIDNRRGVLTAAEHKPGALTAIAATTVVGTGLAGVGASVAATALLALATVTWLLLMPMLYVHHPAHRPGAWFLLCVATQGLVVLAVPLVATRSVWPALLLTAVAAFGMLLFLDDLRTFDWAELLNGGGDQWVLGGALAISSLAVGVLISDRARDGLPASAVAPLQLADLGLWAAAAAAGVGLALAEAIRPRLEYHAKRWATVFPLAMTAAASEQVARATGHPTLLAVGEVLRWVALACWVVVGLSGVRALARSARLPSGEDGKPRPRHWWRRPFATSKAA